MRQCLTTESAKTPVRAARKEDCEKDAASRNPAATLPPVNGRQMICGRGVDDWHEVPLFAIILPCPAEAGFRVFSG